VALWRHDARVWHDLQESNTVVAHVQAVRKDQLMIYGRHVRQAA